MKQNEDTEPCRAKADLANAFYRIGHYFPCNQERI